MIKHSNVGATGIGEANVMEFNVASSQFRNATGRCGGFDLSFDVQKFKKTLRRARRLRNFSPHLTEFAKAAGGKYCVQDELPKATRRNASREHILRADPQHHHNAGKDQKDHSSRQQATHFAGVTCGGVSLLDGSRETRLCQFLVGEGLQRTHGADEFVGIAGGRGKRVLRCAAALANRATEANQ